MSEWKQKLHGPVEAARIVAELLERGDHRLLASDGPCGGQLPDLSPDEWGEVYEACRAIARDLCPKRVEGEPYVADPFRAWALANVKRATPHQRKCGHASGMEFQACVECAHELGRREGHVEAGAYYAHDEVFA